MQKRSSTRRRARVWIAPSLSMLRRRRRRSPRCSECRDGGHTFSLSPWERVGVRVKQPEPSVTRSLILGQLSLPFPPFPLLPPVRHPLVGSAEGNGDTPADRRTPDTEVRTLIQSGRCRSHQPPFQVRRSVFGVRPSSSRTSMSRRSSTRRRTRAWMAPSVRMRFRWRRRSRRYPESRDGGRKVPFSPWERAGVRGRLAGNDHGQANTTAAHQLLLAVPAVGTQAFLGQANRVD
jgi:hypothetical protein